MPWHFSIGGGEGGQSPDKNNIFLGYLCGKIVYHQILHTFLASFQLVCIDIYNKSLFPICFVISLSVI